MKKSIYLEYEMVQKAKEYGIKCHSESNHKYDGHPYDIHLRMVFIFAYKYSYLLPDIDEKMIALASSWTHDVIEDARQTYNDVKLVCGEKVADVSYALTNEKGKTRKERANEKYYEGIRNNPVAVFVKICDRLANTKYSKDNNSLMIDVYRKEQKEFKKELFSFGLKPMWDELDKILSTSIEDVKDGNF